MDYEAKLEPSTLKAELIFINVWKDVFVWLFHEADTNMRLGA